MAQTVPEEVPVASEYQQYVKLLPTLFSHSLLKGAGRKNHDQRQRHYDGQDETQLLSPLGYSGGSASRMTTAAVRLTHNQHRDQNPLAHSLLPDQNSAAIPSYGTIISSALPIIAANCAVPLLGLADTAIIGHFAGIADLAAVAVGALVFSFVYWAFGFLRMTTTGYVSQRWDDSDQSLAVVMAARAAVLAAIIALAILLLQPLISFVAFTAFGASQAVETLASAYFDIRIWGAPATLLTYVLFGILIGAGRNATLLWLQLVLNGSNIALDLLFAGYFDMGLPGIALGTILAEYLTVIVGGVAVVRLLRPRLAGEQRSLQWWRGRLSDLAAIRIMMSANGNVMIRTILLLLSFACFINISAGYGDTVLAANHVLLQFVTFSAFFLDGFAFVTESWVGRAAGQRDFARASVVGRRCLVLSSSTAVMLAACIMIGGASVVGLLTDLTPVIEEATVFLPWAAAYVALSFGAFHLDGVFIGATATVGMRNAAIVSTACFIALAWPAGAIAGNHGLWAAFVVYVVLRAICLAWLLHRDGLADLR